MRPVLRVPVSIMPVLNQPVLMSPAETTGVGITDRLPVLYDLAMPVLKLPSPVPLVPPLPMPVLETTDSLKLLCRCAEEPDIAEPELNNPILPPPELPPMPVW